MQKIKVIISTLGPLHLIKKIETLFSQLCDQFMAVRNYAKDTKELSTHIIMKINTLFILQYINKQNKKPIGRIKYALI
ncbi:hypothetical protein C802_01548 [Phocaeicola sartorii]|jgi:hypothetical protein|uniref:Uncharacterized protein n=1 Tax=Phocaeicola sartorii TaxID=671267 RepID=R9IA01_9BACT|nr:hypothetical protein C802_01548 [Phocaeicola sartorii]